MPVEDIVVEPTFQAINNYTCTLYNNGTILADNGWNCYQMSNGSFMASLQPITYYTSAEIMKIEIAGGVMILAVGVATYALYKLYMQRYHRWVRNEKIREKMANNTVTGEDLAELEMPLPGVSKGLLFGAGLLVILAGIVMVLMP